MSVANETFSGAYLHRSFGVEVGPPSSKAIGLGAYIPRSFGVEVGPPAHRAIGMGAYMSFVEGLRGNGLISGTLKVAGPGLPIRRKLRAYEARTWVLLGETYSDAITGVYQFPQARRDRAYTVVAFDEGQVFQSVVADNVTPS